MRHTATSECDVSKVTHPFANADPYKGIEDPSKFITSFPHPYFPQRFYPNSLYREFHSFQRLCSTQVMKALSKDGAPDPGPTSSQSAAHKVFEVTELQELILNHVSLCDLFRAPSVCRVWKTTFTDSSALQKKAQLVADPESDWYEDEFDDEFGLVIDCTVRNIVEQCRVGFELFFVFGSFEHVPAKITPNLRKCFATQPPCTEMEVSPFCCPDAEEILRNSKGITLGDVFDTANRIYAEHEHCPEMLRKIKEMAETDMPWSRYPRFRGSVSHSKDHPARVREVRRLARVEEEHKQRMKALEDAGWGDVWYAFRKARRRGKLQHMKHGGVR